MLEPQNGIAAPVCRFARGRQGRIDIIQLKWQPLTHAVLKGDKSLISLGYRIFHFGQLLADAARFIGKKS